MAEGARSSRRSPYPSRRLRYACENCRRKKSKCPGERPRCSVCARLNQQCVYVDIAHHIVRAGSDERLLHSERHNDAQNLPSSPHTAGRLTTIEARLEQIAASLEAHQAQQSPPTRLSAHPEVLQHELSALDIPKDAVNDGILLYFKYHCNQPCPLFDHLLQHEPLSHRYPPIVLSAMLALSLRRSTHTSLLHPEKRHRLLEQLSQRSWDLLANAYHQFDFDDSYFQALCLLAQIDHTEGKSDRARTQVALGLRLTQSRGMLDKAHYEEEGRTNRSQHQEIVWSLFILDRMLISRGIANPSASNEMYRLPKYTGGPRHPGQTSEVYDAGNSRSISRNFMIVSLYVQMMYIWELVVDYINKKESADSFPLWHNETPRAKIITLLLEFEIPSEPHTYASVSPVDRVLNAPHLKPYFHTWVFLQVTHSSIHCCINHPFIIFVKARQHGSRVPLTFLQKVHKDSLIYASWVAKNLTDMETAGLDVLDPFLAYLVGIATSIHMEHSLSSNPSIAASAKQKLATCMAYVARVASIWPKVGKRLIVLGDLQARMGNRTALHYVEDEYDGAVPVRSVRHVSMSDVDERLMWTLFDSSNEPLSGTLRPKPNFNGPGTGSVDVPSPSQHASSSSIVNSAAQYGPAVQSQSAGSIPSYDAQGPSMLDHDSSMDDLTADWSLLGLPWLAYFPTDTEPLTCI